MSDISGATWLWAAKSAGAIAGSAISIAYVLPRGRREAAARFAVGIVSGLAFGGTAGLKIALWLGLHEVLGPLETALMGSAAASLFAWWVLGFAVTTLRRNFGSYGPQNTMKDQNRDGY